MCSCTPVLVIRSKQKKIETKMFRKPKQREKSNFVVWKKRKKLENESPSRLFLGHRNWNQITVECELNWVFLDAWLRLGIQKWLPITPPPPPTVFPFQHHTHTHTHTHTPAFGQRQYECTNAGKSWEWIGKERTVKITNQKRQKRTTFKVGSTRNEKPEKSLPRNEGACGLIRKEGEEEVDGPSWRKLI